MKRHAASNVAHVSDGRVSGTARDLVADARKDAGRRPALRGRLALCLSFLAALASAAPLRVGVGSSSEPDPARAGTAAAEQARAALGGTAPKLVIVFAARRQLVPALVDGLAAIFPRDLIYGCEGYSPLTTTGNFADQGHTARNAVAVLALGGDAAITVAAADAKGEAGHARCGRELGEALRPKLSPDAGHVIFTFGDQHVGKPNAELVRGLRKVLGDTTRIAGAAAGHANAKEIVRGRIVTATNIAVLVTGDFHVRTATRGGQGDLVGKAREAFQTVCGAGTATPFLGLVFDCGGRRGQLVKQKVLAQEHDVMRQLAPDTPLFGFYGGGEIGAKDDTSPAEGVGFCVSVAGLFAGKGPARKPSPPPLPAPKTAQPAASPELTEIPWTGWQSAAGTWALRQDGRYEQTEITTNCRTFAPMFALRDYVFEVTARKTGGKEGFLVIFRAQDTNSFYWWNVAGWRNTGHAIEKKGSKGNAILCRIPGQVETGRDYLLRVAVQGDHFRCWLDGTLIHDFRDKTFRAGGIGLGTWNTSAIYSSPRLRELRESDRLPQGNRQDASAPAVPDPTNLLPNPSFEQGAEAKAASPGGTAASAEKAAAMLEACPPLAFIRRADYGMRGTNAVMFAHRTGKGSAICTYDPAKPAQGAKTIFETGEGFVFDMNPSYDGRKLVFSHKTKNDEPFHIWEIGADGTGLRQLTRGPYHDVSPVYYPDGRIVFTSSRVESYSLCQNYLACALHIMRGDGSDLRRIDFTTLCTLSPSILQDGSILCTRWEYQDKNIFGWQGLWTINPDGRQLKLYHGNTFRIPNAVYGAREIPGTRTTITTWAAHHHPPVGDLAIVDRGKGLETWDSMWKITHVTPVQKDLADGEHWRKTGIGNRPADRYYRRAFADPFPITEALSVVSFGGQDKTRHHLYLLDHASGKTALLYKTDASCFSPVPIVPRSRPDPIPGDCPQEAGTGTFYVQDVYQGLLQQGVKRGTVRRLRIMSQSPKKYNTEGFRFRDHYPLIGQGTYYVKHNHGTVPVDENGSAYFEAPSNTELYFIALDAQGREVQRMGTVTQITTGERASCIGCHEDRMTPPRVSEQSVNRMSRPPDRITPPSWGAGPVDYVRHVQPVLDRYCIRCHSGAKAPKGKDLTGDRTRFYSLSYETLTYDGLVDFYYINHGPNGVFPALKTGSMVSKLTKILESGHGKVNVDDAGRRAVYAWIDANVPYYGTWDMSRPHTIGGRDAYARTLPGKGPVFAGQGGGRRLTAFQPWVKTYNDFAAKSGKRIPGISHGGPNKFDPRGQINLTRPESSPILLNLLAKAAGGRATGTDVFFPSKEEQGYKTLLAILQEAKASLDQTPRIDMPGGVAIAQERAFGRVF